MTTKAQTIEQELQSILANAVRDDEGEIIATPTDMTWEDVSSNTQTIAQIVAAAVPIGKAGSVAQFEAASYANECAKSLLLLVSKMPFEGQTKTDTRIAIPAGTDWNRSDVRTKAAVKSFYNEVVDLVAMTKWQMSTGGKAKDFPFVKSVEYFFGKLRREVLPQSTLVTYGLASTEPAERVTANRANLNVAVKQTVKLLNGVKLYPKTFEDTTSAIDSLKAIIARCEQLQENAKEALKLALSNTVPETLTGTDG